MHCRVLGSLLVLALSVNIFSVNANKNNVNVGSIEDESEHEESADQHDNIPEEERKHKMENENGNINNGGKDTELEDSSVAKNDTDAEKDKVAYKELLKNRVLGSSFDNIALERLFFDKSQLLKDLFKTKEKVILITRPPKWGKSVTLDMIKSFYNVEVNHLGEKKDRESMLQPKMFHGSDFNTDVGYKKLLISRSGVCKKMGEYPVIYLDLAGIDGFNESQILWNLYDRIDEVYKNQFPVLNETSYLFHMDSEDQDKLEFNRYFVRGVVDYVGFKKSLTFLTKLLYKAYQNQVLILVDNYDKSLLDLYLKYGPNHEASRTLRKAIDDLLRKSLKHNPKLRKAVVMGVFPCAKYDLLPKIDLIDCNIFNDYFGQFFGLSEQETISLLGDFPSQRVESINRFYHGYVHGNRTGLANPYSIMNVILNEGDIKPYWSDKDDIKIFNTALKTYYKHDYKELMSNRPIKNLYLSQKLNLSEIIEPENLIEMLVYNGYLHAVPSDYKLIPIRRLPGKNQTYATITFHNVSVPNKEILYSFHKAIKQEKLEKEREKHDGSE